MYFYGQICPLNLVLPINVVTSEHLQIRPTSNLPFNVPLPPPLLSPITDIRHKHLTRQRHRHHQRHASQTFITDISQRILSQTIKHRHLLQTSQTLVTHSSQKTCLKWSDMPCFFSLSLVEKVCSEWQRNMFLIRYLLFTVN